MATTDLFPCPLIFTLPSIFLLEKSHQVTWGRKAAAVYFPTYMHAFFFSILENMHVKCF